MLLPAIAAKTYENYKGKLGYKKITKRMISKLKSIASPIKRAIWSQRQVDKYLDHILNDPIVKEHNQCRKGCSFCCYTQVSLSGDEGQLLAQLIVDGKEIDLDRLYYQSQAKNDAYLWYKLPYAMRKCVFLDSKNQCSIYEHRPMVCRSNNVISQPAHCSTEEGKEKSVTLINTHEADMAIVGAFKSSSGNGALPYVLWKAIENHKVGGDKMVFSNDHFRFKNTDD